MLAPVRSQRTCESFLFVESPVSYTVEMLPPGENMLTRCPSTNTAFPSPCVASHLQSGVEGRTSLADVAASPSGYGVGTTPLETLAPVPASVYSRLTPPEPDGVGVLDGVGALDGVAGGVGATEAVTDDVDDGVGEAPCDSVAVAEDVAEGASPANTVRLAGSLTAASVPPGPATHGLARKASCGIAAVPWPSR